MLIDIFISLSAFSRKEKTFFFFSENQLNSSIEV